MKPEIILKLYYELPDPVIILNSNFEFLLCNNQANRFFEDRKVKLEGKNFNELIDTDLNNLLSNSKKNKDIVDFKCSLHNGLNKKVLLQNTLRKVHLKNKTFILVSMSDITKRIDFETNTLHLTSKIQDTERRNISMELHDGVAQDLVLLGIYIEQCKNEKGINDNSLDYLQKVDSLLQKTMMEIRRISYNITPPDLESGFFEGLKNMFQRFNMVNDIDIMVDFNDNIAEKFDMDAEMAYQVFRIFQEFINNSIKHSKSQSIILKIDYYNKNLYFDILDDGIGFDMDNEDNWGMGIKNIRYRAELFNIQYSFLSKEGEGTRLSFNIPYKNIFLKRK